jgi:hypothetical protein
LCRLRRMAGVVGRVIRAGRAFLSPATSRGMWHGITRYLAYTEERCASAYLCRSPCLLGRARGRCEGVQGHCAAALNSQDGCSASTQQDSAAVSSEQSEGLWACDDHARRSGLARESAHLSRLPSTPRQVRGPGFCPVLSQGSVWARRLPPPQSRGHNPSSSRVDLVEISSRGAGRLRAGGGRPWAGPVT